MSHVERLIAAKAEENAKRGGRFIPSSNDKLNAQFDVLSGNRDEVRSIEEEVEAYNRLHADSK